MWRRPLLALAAASFLLSEVVAAIEGIVTLLDIALRAVAGGLATLHLILTDKANKGNDK